MKYQKLILDINTLGLIKDRLDKITNKGHFSYQTIEEELNPLKTDFGSIGIVGNGYVYPQSRSVIRKLGSGRIIGINIDVRSVTLSWEVVPALFGDTVYLSQNEILIKSGKSQPNHKRTKCYVRKICLK